MRFLRFQPIPRWIDVEMLSIAPIDNMGQDEGNESPKHPRGVQGYALLGDQVKFDSWKVQGKQGGNVK